MQRLLQLAEEETRSTQCHVVVMLAIMEMGSFVYHASHVMQMQSRLARVVQEKLQMLSRVHAMQDTMVLEFLVRSAFLIISQNQVLHLSLSLLSLSLSHTHTHTLYNMTAERHNYMTIIRESLFVDP